MRQLVQDPEAASALGQAGAAAVRERLSPERLGAIVRQRLGTLVLKPSRREALRHAPAPLQALD
jgi:hypothetical protein